ncbi:lipopolysaccharide biosynthesis protein [Spartinivicinus ruber]|uniref:lipopolysaccharide biosynthesis protein n=1 Tax=Spartinivicinus ruber TaxID=2683272 RepID=UPI0013D8064A|nr:lipopolysaccharide biosynthesis protein [Spartinivicinus ruber]
MIHLMDDSSITKKMGIGAVWMVFLRLCVRLLSIISLFIMARLLVPEDYGIVALAMSFYAILDVITTFNFDLPLIQNQHATKEDYNTAWSLNILMGLFIAIGLLIGSHPMAALFNEPQLTSIFPCLAVMAILQGFTNIGIVNFRKELKLKKEFHFEFSKKILSFIVTVTAGVLLKSYWALILGMITNSLAGLLLSFIMSDYRPSLSLKSWRSLLNFSKWMLFTNILGFTNNRLMMLIVGSSLNTKVLGNYSMMKEVADITTVELVLPIQKALFPGYSKLTNDRHQLAQVFLNSISMIAFFGVPIAVTLAILNEYFVIILLSDKWLSESWMLKIFCLSGAFSLVTGATFSIYYALAKPQIVTAILFIQGVIRVILFSYFITQNQILEALLSILATAIFGTLLSLVTSCRLLTLPILQLLWPLTRTVLAAICLTGCLLLLNAWFPLHDNFFINLLTMSVMAIIGLAIYSICHFSLWYFTYPLQTASSASQPTGAEAIIIQLVKPKLSALKLKLS